MPSIHQAGSDGDYPSQYYKLLATKPDHVIRGIVRGIRDRERARAYIEAEISLAKDEDRDPRSELIGILNGKVEELKHAEQA